MLFQFALIAPLISLWIWHPFRLWGWRAYAVAVFLSTLGGASPALLIYAMRETSWSYAVIAPLQVVSGGIVSVLALTMVWALIRDTVWLLIRLTGRRLITRWGDSPQWSLCALGIFTLISTWGIYEGTRVPVVREHVVEVPRLPPALDGLKIAVIADIHASPVNDATYVQALVERTQASQPDMIVLPGDLVDGDAGTQSVNLAPLAQLNAPLGVFAAPGNHEYYSGYNAWGRVFQALQLDYLANETRLLNVRGHTLAISGIGDPAYGRISQQNEIPGQPEGAPPDIKRVAQQAQGADFHLLLAHQPKLSRQYALYGVDLQISGHTHGGLIRGMDRWLVAPANNGYVRGLYEVDAMRLFVSSGAGLWAGFAVRLGVPSAIDVLTLKSPQPR